jgi:opacity protein-like surface antigen
MLTGALGYAFRNANNTDQLGLNLGLNVILGEKYRPEDGYDFLHRRGTLLVGGDIGNLNLSNIGEQTNLLGNVNLEAGYFLTERFALEGQLAYSSGYFDLGTSSIPREYLTRGLNISLGGRYFFLPGRRFQPYLGGGVDYEHGFWRETTSEPERSSGYDDFGAYLKTGFLHHLNDRLAIDFNAGYRSSFSNEYNSGFTGGLGLKVFLGKNRR